MIGPFDNKLVAQSSANCPEYSFCIEFDPLDCNKIKISINGVQGLEISGLRFQIDVSGIPIDIQETENEFSNTAVGQHFSGSIGFSVTQNLIEINYAALDPPSGFLVTEECLDVGFIIIDHIEVDCIPDHLLGTIQITPFLSGGPLYIGPDLQSSVMCPQYTIDCPCTSMCSIDNWSFCFSQDGCGKVQVLLLGLQGVDNVSGIRFGFDFDPELEIDEQKTTSSINSSTLLGANNWEDSDFSITDHSITFFFRNPTGIGNNINIVNDPELLFEIFFKPQPGVCYDFGSTGVDYAPQSGLFIGDDFSDPELEFCDNFFNVCSGQVCSDAVALSGNILRPTPGGSCNEAIDFGFPYGEVNVYGSFCDYDYEFSVLTDQEGYFELEVFPNTEYTIIPAYTEEHKYACGVNSVDVDIIRSLVLGQSTCFPFAFSNLAADLSLDGSISTFDIALIERYIQEIQYPTAGKWRFLPVTQYQTYFQNVSCPALSVPGYDTMIVANVTTFDHDNANFRAIKMGDVDGTCEECLEPSTLQFPQNSLMVSAQYDVENQLLIIRNSDLLIETVSVINLVIDGGSGILLEEVEDEDIFKEKYMEIRGTGAKGSGYGWVSLEERGKKLSVNQSLATFKVEKFVTAYDLNLTLGELVADGVLYNLELDADYVEIIEKEDASHLDGDPIRVYPNPGKGAINISIPSEFKGPYEVVILDVLGRQHEVFQEADNEIFISTFDLPIGTYILSVKSDNFSESIIWLKQ